MIQFFDTDHRDKAATPATSEELALIRDKLADADAILVGLGSGMSSAAGFDHYHDGPAFREHFGDYAEAYGFKGMFDGYYHLFATPEEQWAYWGRYLDYILKTPPGDTYLALRELLSGREYFVLTTNVDHQVPRVFPEARHCAYQGDAAHLQCGQPCHDGLYPTAPVAADLVAKTADFRVPADAIPRCPRCHRQLLPWWRDPVFLEGEFWREQVDRYRDFVARHKDRKLLLLELGVGEMTPSIIKLPFWQLTRDNPDAFYVTVNLGKAAAPEHLKGRSLAIADDIAHFLAALNER